MKEVAQQEHVLSAHAGSEHGKQPAPVVMFNSILLFAISSSVSCSKSFNIRSIVHLRTYLCCILKLYHAQITGASHICFISDGFMITGAAEGTCKERSDGIEHFAPSDPRAEFTRDVSGSRVKISDFRLGSNFPVSRGVSRVQRQSRPFRRKEEALSGALKKHRVCGVLWCALRDSNPGPTD